MTPGRILDNNWTLIKAALWYADHGFPVFPLRSVMKGRCSCPEAREPSKARALTFAIAQALGIDVDSPAEDQGQLGAIGTTGRLR